VKSEGTVVVEEGVRIRNKEISVKRREQGY
jgi:hypothetical protein